VHSKSGLVWFLLLFTLPAFSQQIQLGRSSSQPQHVTQPTSEEDATRSMTNDMAKRAARERVAALKNDTDKLLKLSVELKDYVDKSDANVLSLEVIKKAEAIEKLAKSVKDKMKGPN